MHNVSTSNFKNVNRLYPNGTILGFKEVNFIDGGWVSPIPMYNNKNNDFNMIIEYMEGTISNVQLIIENEFGMLVYPDYSIKELF